MITKFNDFKYHAEVFKDIGTSHSSAFKADSKEKQSQVQQQTDEQNDKLPPFIAIMTGSILIRKCKSVDKSMFHRATPVVQ